MRSYNLSEVLKSRNAQPLDGNRQGSFWEMQPFEGGSSWISKWQGESPWEKHSKGDEFLHVLKGQVEVVLITSTGKVSALVPERSIFVVPKDHWHKQLAQAEVVVLGATPGVTESSEIEPSFE